MGTLGGSGGLAPQLRLGGPGGVAAPELFHFFGGVQGACPPANPIILGYISTYFIMISGYLTMISGNFSGQFRVTSYKKGLKKCFFENLGERPIEMY